MSDFKASRDLDAAEFKQFSSQCIFDLDRSARRLAEAAYELKRAQDTLDFWRGKYSENKEYCKKHGVPINAV